VPAGPFRPVHAEDGAGTLAEALADLSARYQSAGRDGTAGVSCRLAALSSCRRVYGGFRVS
jgi:hypothetical protein